MYRKVVVNCPAKIVRLHTMAIMLIEICSPIPTCMTFIAKNLSNVFHIPYRVRV